MDAGNDLVTAEDVGKAVKYGFGVKDGMISVARVENAELSGPKIPNISLNASMIRKTKTQEFLGINNYSKPNYYYL